MRRVKVMVNGLPGKMAEIVARLIIKERENLSMELVPFSQTGDEIKDGDFRLGKGVLHLVRALEMRVYIRTIKDGNFPFISVDFTTPASVIPNVRFYCENGLPFVMGTTGYSETELAAIKEMVATAGIPAVIAPNMAREIVGLQAMMEFASVNFSNLFSEYDLDIVESHQAGKKDTSGTARAMIKYFNALGMPFDVKHIEMIRDPQEQRKMGVPEEALAGHGWHTYGWRSGDGTVLFRLTHNVNGREIYARGTISAILFLESKMQEGARGVFSMIDVIKAGF